MEVFLLFERIEIDALVTESLFGVLEGFEKVLVFEVESGAQLGCFLDIVFLAPIVEVLAGCFFFRPPRGRRPN